MDKTIGQVTNFQGKFYAKDSQGNIRELKNGDTLYAGEIVVPDKNNAPSELISILPTDGTKPFVFSSTQEQLLDITLLNEGFNNEELAFNPEVIQQILTLASKELSDDDTTIAKFAQLDGDSTDINSDLRDANWPGIVDYEKIQNDDLLNLNTDTGTTFAIRDGDSTDIVSDLREAEWFGTLEKPKYNGDIENKNEATLLHLNEENINENGIPIAVNDTQIIVRETGENVTGQLLMNDIAGSDGLIKGKEIKEFTYNTTTYSFDHEHSTYTINTTLGTLTVNQNGTWELNPTGISIDEHTSDNFSYKIIDSNGDISNSAIQPFLMFDKDMATNIHTTTEEDTSKTILLNDRGGDVIITDTSSSTQKTLGTNQSINITRTSDGEVVGTVTNNGDGTVTFTPSSHYCGEDAEFSYEVVRSDNTTIVNDSVIITVTPTAESKTTNTNNDSQNDVITQGDKTYSSINESTTYTYIPLTGLSVTNEDDRGDGTNPFASEITTIKLSNVPVGFKFQYNDGTTDHELTVTNLNDGVTLPFEYISTLQIKPTDFFAGEIQVKMEVITVDCENPGGIAQSTNISTPDYLMLNITNVANGIQALNAAQATGLEDAGRSNGNTTNDSNTSAITNPENGIALDITATTIDTSGREKITTIIDKIPDGGAIYYNDSNGTITVDNTGTIIGSNPNISVNDNNDGTWKITIIDFKNNAPLKFIPPHNSNEDYNFEVTAYTTDGESISSSSETKIIDVQITGVADIPVHDNFKTLESDGVTNGGIYSAVVIEDNSNSSNGATISFEGLYKEAGLASYDSDNSEVLSIVITNLGTNFSVADAAGISFNGASGTSREWSFNVADLSNVVLTTSKNYSGEISFQVKHITTENDGNSKTDTKDVKILVKPLVEATITTNSNATEDESSQINFSILHQNGDTDETLEALWINKADITGKDFTLYTDVGTTTVLTAGANISDEGAYYKLTGAAINSVYIKYNANIGSANTSDNSFGIKYTVKDSVTTNGETFDSINTEVSGVYNITLLSVTDTISVDTSNVLGANVAYTQPGGVKTITLNDLGSFTLDVDITGNSDTDGSEKATRLVIEGVQRGITVDGATMGISGDKNIWFLDIPDQDIDADGAKYTVTFNVNHTITPDTDSTITITAYSKDSGSTSDDIELASTTIDFIDGMPDGGAGVPPADITALMSVKNTLITEDTSFTLADVLTVTADSVNDTDNNAIYSIAFRSLEKVTFDMDLTTHTINSYNDGGVNVYVVTATGSQASIDNMLNSVYLKPLQDYNTNNAAGTHLTFNAVLTAYEATGYGRDTATVDFSSADNGTSVKPVTDDIDSIVTKNNIDEDTSTTITITFDTVDDPDYTIVQGATDDTPATTVAITHTSGIYGTLTWSGGGTYTFDGSNTIANVPIADIGNGNLTFTPTEHKSGNVTFTYTIFAKETNADNISETSKNFTISVAPVADGLLLPEIKGQGDEDTYIQIYSNFSTNTPLDGATMIDTDGSETIMSMFIEKVPEDFLIYIGESGAQTLATKGSVDIDGNYSWTINITGGIPKVWLKAPQNWSSTTPVDLTLKTVVKDGSSTTNVTENFTVTVDSVVDGFSTVTPNDTLQTASMDVPLNLNANAIDLDGSETAILTLSGFGAADVTFKQDGVDISANVNYNGGSDTYTISNIDLSVDKLNKLTFQKAGLQGVNIDYSFKTIESDDSEISAVESGSFLATTDNIITNITTLGTVGETDRLELSAGGIDFSSITSTSIEKIDLTQNGDTNITNVTMDDIIARTDGTNDLIIIADNSNDSIELKNDGGNSWSQGSNITYGNQTFETYTNSGDPTVTVQISEEATITIA